MYKYLTAICLAFSSINAANPELPQNANVFLSNHTHDELNTAFEALAFDDTQKRSFIETHLVPWLSTKRTSYPIDPNDSGVLRGTSAPNFDEVLFQTVKNYLPSDQSGAVLDYACGNGLQPFLSAMLLAVKAPLHFVTAVDPYMTQSEVEDLHKKKSELEAFLERGDLVFPLKVVRSNIANLEPRDQKFAVITFRDAAHLLTPLQMRHFFQDAFTRTTEDGRLIIGAITQSQFYRVFKPTWSTYFDRNTPEAQLLTLHGAINMMGSRVSRSEIMTNFTKLFSASQAAGWVLEKAFFTSKTPESQDIQRVKEFNNPETELSNFEKFFKGVLEEFCNSFLDKKPNNQNILYDRVYLIFQK